MKWLSSLDVAFSFAETPTGSMTIGGLTVCNPSGAPDFTFDAVKDLIASRLPEMSVRCRVNSWWSCRESKPMPYPAICRLNCRSVPFRFGSVGRRGSS